MRQNRPIASSRFIFSSRRKPFNARFHEFKIIYGTLSFLLRVVSFYTDVHGNTGPMTCIDVTSPSSSQSFSQFSLPKQYYDFPELLLSVLLGSHLDYILMQADCLRVAWFAPSLFPSPQIFRVSFFSRLIAAFLPL